MGTGATGTVTFLFTDIEGSTQRWQLDDRAMAEALAVHDDTLRSAIEGHDGVVFKHTGDGMCAVFTSAPHAVAAALAAQSALTLPVRMGLHTGEAEMRDGDYFGPTLNRAARVMDAGHGGQVLLSSSTAGLARDHQLIDLGEHVLKGLDAPERIFQVGGGTFPALRTHRDLAGNLPTDLTAFIGREDEIMTLVATVAAHRLVTLIGVGGTGKTRLAVEAAHAMASSFPDGCWLVDLAAVSVEDTVPYAFADGLRLTPPQDRDVIDDLVSRLRHKRLLMIVDNCEHILSVTADVVERFVAGCPTMAVLATSREPLMVRGEQLVPVPSLSPEESERLFLDRAHAEAPDLVIDADQARAVTELCRRLDGLPLALELAASRVRALTPVELVANLEERFRMLVGGRRTRMERHQTMRGTLDWSYDLCSQTERAVFDRLAVFPAGFDVAAARAVAAGDGVIEFDVVDVIPHLVDRSLLQRATAGDGTTHYRMLETMRAYGREHLLHQGASEEVRERHARHMAATIGVLSTQLVGPDDVAVWRRLADYKPDSVVAVDWCIEHEEWDAALCAAWAGARLTEREVSETLDRIYVAAVAAGGVPDDLFDELEHLAPSLRLRETVADQVARAWRMLRADRPIPSHRYSPSPFADFNDGGLEAADVDVFLASVARWKSAPTSTRFYAEWFAIRALAHGGHADRADGLLQAFGEYVTTLGSEYATRAFLEVNGTCARVLHDWPTAVRWYGEFCATRSGPLATWFDLVGA